MTPEKSHSDTVGLVANKVMVEGRGALFNLYFYVPKYRSSDALPAPDFFLSIKPSILNYNFKFRGGLFKFILYPHGLILY